MATMTIFGQAMDKKKAEQTILFEKVTNLFSSSPPCHFTLFACTFTFCFYPVLLRVHAFDLLQLRRAREEEVEAVRKRQVSQRTRSADVAVTLLFAGAPRAAEEGRGEERD